MLTIYLLLLLLYFYYLTPLYYISSLLLLLLYTNSLYTDSLYINSTVHFTNMNSHKSWATQNLEKSQGLSPTHFTYIRLVQLIALNHQNHHEHQNHHSTFSYYSYFSPKSYIPTYPSSNVIPFKYLVSRYLHDLLTYVPTIAHKQCHSIVWHTYNLTISATSHHPN